MRRVVYHVASTLDGYISDPDDGYAAFPAKGPHVDEYLASLSGYDDVLMGRRTYEPAIAAGVANPYPIPRLHVFSRTLHLDHPGVVVHRDDPAGVVRRLKEQPGKPIYLCGGGDLARQLFDAGLVDEVLVKLNPLIFSAGQPLVRGGYRPRNLALRSAKVYNDVGVLLLAYDVVHA
jgi:dihydrofolate reductase